MFHIAEMTWILKDMQSKSQKIKKFLNPVKDYSFIVDLLIFLKEWLA